MNPRPPAFETAATSSGVSPPPAKGAWKMGCCTFKFLRKSEITSIAVDSSFLRCGKTKTAAGDLQSHGGKSAGLRAWGKANLTVSLRLPYHRVYFFPFKWPPTSRALSSEPQDISITGNPR